MNKQKSDMQNPKNLVRFMQFGVSSNETVMQIAMIISPFCHFFLLGLF